MVEKWLAYELLQLELADIFERVRPSPGRIGYSPARVRPILMLWLLWEDCPSVLDATLGAKDDVAVVVLGIGEVLNSGEKPSPMVFGRAGARPSRRECTGVYYLIWSCSLPTTLIIVFRFVSVLA